MDTLTSCQLTVRILLIMAVSTVLSHLVYPCRTGRSRIRTLVYCKRLWLIKYTKMGGSRHHCVKSPPLASSP